VLSLPASFSIAKAFGVGSVSLASWTYGDAANAPVPTSASNGTGSLSYSYRGAGSTSYGPSSAPPSNAGSYPVTASFAATATYPEVLSLPASFSIAKASGVGSVSLAGWTYGAAANAPVPTSATNGRGSLSYSYLGAGSTSYGPSATPPTNAGSYTVTASFAATANYNEVLSTPASFSIAKASGTGSVSLAGWTYGATANNPASTSATNGTGSLSYSYRGAGSTTYGPSATKPSDVGDYTVTATFAATANYNEVLSLPAAFSIAKAAQSITFTPHTALNVRSGTYTLDATSTSGLPVLFRLAPTNAATLSGYLLTLHRAGSITLTAYIAPSLRYGDAHEVSATIDLQLDFLTYAVVKPSGSLLMNVILLAADDYQLASYRWYKNGLPVGNPNETVAAILTNGAIYRFDIETTDGQLLSSTTYEHDALTAVKPARSSPLRVYPNPVTRGLLTISNEQWKAGDVVELYNMQGVLMGTHAATSATITINISQLPAAVYIVKVGNRTAEVVKQ
jgi:hypothetical protein